MKIRRRGLFRLAAGVIAVLPDLPTVADFGRLIADETAKWGKVIKLAGIKPE